MRVSELIRRLTELQAQMGDVLCTVDDNDSGTYYVSRVEVVPAEDVQSLQANEGLSPMEPQYIKIG